MNYRIYRKFKNTLFLLITLAAAMAVLIPLFMIIQFVLVQGASSLSWSFFTELPKPVGETGGGMRHAILGTIYIVGLGAPHDDESRQEDDGHQFAKRRERTELAVGGCEKGTPAGRRIEPGTEAEKHRNGGQQAEGQNEVMTNVLQVLHPLPQNDRGPVGQEADFDILFRHLRPTYRHAQEVPVWRGKPGG